MSNDDAQWWDAQCGEYVLGTLRGPERDVLERILSADDDARDRVAYWENVLAPLESRMQLRQPPAHVLPLIMRQIRGQQSEESDGKRLNSNETLSNTAQPILNDLTGTWTEDIDNVLAADTLEKPNTLDASASTLKAELIAQPRNSGRLWKYLALLATAVALVLGGILANQNTQNTHPWPISASGSFSVLQDAERRALWLVTMNDKASKATIVALSPPALSPNQSYQLWLLQADDAGATSIGLLPRSIGQSSTISLSDSIARGQYFAVSLEPASGSPETSPTGTVLFTGIIQHLRDTSR